MARYIAVAGQDAGTCEALHWQWSSISTFVLATGDDEEEVADEAVEAVGHQDVHVHDAGEAATPAPTPITCTVVTDDGWRADVHGDCVELSEPAGYWAGQGKVRIDSMGRAHIDDCPAVLPEGVYEALEAELTDAPREA
jgi:hypothetical protein